MPRNFHGFGRTVARRIAAAFAAASLAAAVPASARACACGCDAFDVQTSAMMPVRPGGTAFIEEDYLNQNQNWGGASKAPSTQNSDKQIRTGFFTVGAQYMFNSDWGVIGELPYWSRNFKTDTGAGIGDFTHSAVGDIRLQGIYSGFASDMSSGLTFGLKLPSGDFSAANFDRDTQIGSGSTDLLLGAYRMGLLDAGNLWDWFADAQFDEPMLIAAGYRPGAEIDAASGIYYNGGMFDGFKVEPLAQAVASWRWRDSGPAADSLDSGYRRLTLGPGLQAEAGRWTAFMSVGFPVLQYVNGDQLVAGQLYKFLVTWSF